MASCTFSRPAVSGARSRKTCRREARSTTTSICGHMTARWNESTTRSMNSVAKKRRKRGAFIDPHGYDAGKKIKGKKRHILVDTLGLLLHAIVHPADIQDRD